MNSSAVKGQPFVEVDLGRQASRILVHILLPLLQSADADIRQARLHTGHAAASVLEQLEAGVEGCAKRRVGLIRVGEQGRQTLQQQLNRLLVLAQVDQEVVGQGQLHVLDVRVEHHARLRERVAQVVEVERAVVGDEADLGAGVARYLVQVLEKGLAEALQVAGGDCVVGHVKQVQIHCWWRWTKLKGNTKSNNL